MQGTALETAAGGRRSRRGADFRICGTTPRGRQGRLGGAVARHRGQAECGRRDRARPVNSRRAAVRTDGNPSRDSAAVDCCRALVPSRPESGILKGTAVPFFKGCGIPSRGRLDALRPRRRGRLAVDGGEIFYERSRILSGCPFVSAERRQRFFHSFAHVAQNHNLVQGGSGRATSARPRKLAASSRPDQADSSSQWGGGPLAAEASDSIRRLPGEAPRRAVGRDAFARDPPWRMSSRTEKHREGPSWSRGCRAPGWKVAECSNAGHEVVRGGRKSWTRASW